MTQSDLFDMFTEDLVPIPEVKNLGTSNLSFDGLLEPGLQVYEDGGASGCGGLNGCQNVLELGSGTGLVGLAIALNEKREDLNVWVTDIDALVPLMQKNIDLNGLSNVHARTLNWGEELPGFAKTNKIDMVLAADCVYLESAFPLLERTLLDLSDNDTPIFVCYKKRRNADKRFFKAIKKYFTIEEIKDHEDYAQFYPQSVYLYKMHRK